MISTPISKVGVIGSGTMGQGITQACIMAGYQVFLFDIDLALTENASKVIDKSLQMLVDKGKLDASAKREYLNNLITSNALSDIKVDLIIEAVVENLDVKQNIFRQLEEINSPQTILTSNTSSLSIGKICVGLKERKRFAGLHFFNPAPLMKLVEVVQAEMTSIHTVDVLRNFCLSLQKLPVLVKDSPGFIVNRVARLYYVEALRLLEEGVAEVESIDALMRNSGFRMGPFELMDLIGIDTNLAVTKSIYEAFGQNSKFKPSAIQQQKVDNKQLGRKTGKGFYEYNA
jgi:3-hydroxybutyryl-CoA dehydrogenase